MRCKGDEYSFAAELFSCAKVVDDFPTAGVDFIDISPILADPPLFSSVVGRLVRKLMKADVIAAVDARGFLFAAPVAYMLSCPIIMLRKEGKLPGEVAVNRFKNDYAESTMAVQKVDLTSKTVAVVDDVLATGNTFRSANQLLRGLGASSVVFASVFDLTWFDNKIPGGVYNTICELMKE